MLSINLEAANSWNQLFLIKGSLYDIGQLNSTQPANDHKVAICQIKEHVFYSLTK